MRCCSADRLKLPLPGGKAAESGSQRCQRCQSCLQSRCGCCCLACLPLWLFLVFVIIELLVFYTCKQPFQAWALQYPGSPLTRAMAPPIEVAESIFIGSRDGQMLQLREDYGDNFAAAGMVWLGSFADTSLAVTTPQERTYQLGEHPLLYDNLPDVENSRLVFLLALSDQAAGGSGNHEAFRNCFVDHMLEHPDVEACRLDSTAASLLDALASDYAALPHAGVSDEFFSSTTQGLYPFIQKYLHYVMLGIDPSDSDIQGVLVQFFSGQTPIGHYFWPHGYVLSYTELIDEVAAIYLASPAFARFVENDPAYFSMTNRELAVLAASILRIAGVQGFYQASKIVLGAWKMPVFPGSTEGFDQRTVWDSLDLSDVLQVQQYIAECLRLDNPVTVVHRVASAEFSVDIDGSSYTYPKGTRIGIPLWLGNTDKKFWGESAYIFNSSRSELMDNALSFNSRGDTHVGRECPAKLLVMQTLTSMLQKLGAMRRASGR